MVSFKNVAKDKRTHCIVKEIKKTIVFSQNKTMDFLDEQFYWTIYLTEKKHNRGKRNNNSENERIQIVNERLKKTKWLVNERWKNDWKNQMALKRTMKERKKKKKRVHLYLSPLGWFLPLLPPWHAQGRIYPKSCFQLPWCLYTCQRGF